VLACLLCLSTVYCRYHYVVDVMAGLVTAAVLVPLGNWLYFKFQGAATEENLEDKAGASKATPGIEC
jgi:membrane-associated phospholipid phosphatase